MPIPNYYDYIQANIIETGSYQKCRLCRTSHYMLSGCPILAIKEYMENNISTETKIVRYQHIADPIVDTAKVTILWDNQIETDRKMTANRPCNKILTRKQCLFIDVVIPYK